MPHPISRLLEIIINERRLENESMTCFTKANNFACDFVSSCDSYSNSVLFSTETHYRPELIDEDNEFMHLDDMEMLDAWRTSG